MKALLLGIVGVICCIGCGGAHAAFVDTATETTTGVIFSGVGSFNLTSAPVVSTVGTFGGGVNAAQASLIQNGNGLKYAFRGPTSFGLGNYNPSTSQAGDYFGFLASDFIPGENFFLPTGYVSGTQLSTSLIFAGATFASLGVTPGAYIYTYGSGLNTDTITLQIGPTATRVPEPASLALLGLSVVGIAAVRRRRAA